MASIINSTDTGQGGLIATGDNSDELQLQTAETTAVTINSSQNVVVGATSPVDVYITGATSVTPKFQIYGTSAANSTLSLIRSNNTPYLSFSNGSSGNNVVDNSTIGRIVASGYDGTNYRVGGEILFEVNGTPGTGDMPGRINFATTSSGSATPTNRMQITSDGYVRLSSATGGIQFGGDTAAANALDDYEEGTFTVTYYGSTTAGSTTYAMFGRGANYTKIGRLVWVTLYMNVSSATGTGNLTIGGLPFAAGTTSNPPPITGSLLITGGSNWTSSIVSCGVYMSGSSATTATIRYTAGATPGAQTTVTISNTATIAASFCYYAA